MGCADDQDSLLFSRRQCPCRDQQVTGDDEGRSTTLDCFKLGILAVTQNNQATRFDIVHHRFRLHRANEDAIPQRAASLHKDPSPEGTHQVISFQWYAVDGTWIKVIKKEFGEIFGRKNAMDFVFCVNDRHRPAVMFLQQLPCF